MIRRSGEVSKNVPVGLDRPPNKEPRLNALKPVALEQAEDRFAILGQQSRVKRRVLPISRGRNLVL